MLKEKHNFFLKFILKSDRFFTIFGKLLKLVVLIFLACYVLAPISKSIVEQSQFIEVINKINSEHQDNEGIIKLQGK